MSVTVGSHVYSVPWWWAVVVWLAASTALLVWEGLKKVQEVRRSQQRSPEPWRTTDFGPYRSAPRTSPPLQYPSAGHVGGRSAAPSPQPQEESNSWRLWLSVAAEIAGILGLLVSLVK